MLYPILIDYLIFLKIVAEVYYRYMEAYLLWREQVLGKFIKVQLSSTQEYPIQGLDVSAS